MSYIISTQSELNSLLNERLKLQKSLHDAQKKITQVIKNSETLEANVTFSKLLQYVEAIVPALVPLTPGRSEPYVHTEAETINERTGIIKILLDCTKDHVTATNVVKHLRYVLPEKSCDIYNSSNKQYDGITILCMPNIHNFYEQHLLSMRTTSDHE